MVQALKTRPNGLSKKAIRNEFQRKMRSLLQKDIAFFLGDKDVWLTTVEQKLPSTIVTLAKGYRLLNSADPIESWKTSSRISQIPFAYQRTLLPETKEEAINLLQSLNGSGIIFADQPYVEPFPFGIVWLNFRYGGSCQAYGMSQCQRYCEPRYSNSCGYLGNRFYQDGSKFQSISPFKVVLKRSWLRSLADEMMVFREICKKDIPIG